MKTHLIRRYAMPFISTLIFLAIGASYAADPIDQSRQIITKTNKKLENTQREINSLHDDTASMLDQYKAEIKESETYTTYNHQLGSIVDSQAEELDSLESQIDDIEVTSKEIMPLMGRMINTLQQFIVQDLPFLPKERSERIEKLHSNIKRADLSVAEKYRKILEAYQIEIEYGTTLEAYTAELDEIKVNFLKVGRTAFFYQSLDKKNIAVWNKHKNDWQMVTDSDVKHSVDIAMKMARKQRSPELLTILASKVEASK